MTVLAEHVQVDEQLSVDCQDVSMPTGPVDAVAAWRRDPHTWSVAVADWLAALSNAHTKSAYGLALRQFLGWWLWRNDHSARLIDVADAHLWSVTTAAVQAWQQQLLTRGMAPASANSKVSSICSFFQFCMEHVTTVDRKRGLDCPLLQFNPAVGVERLPVQKLARVVLSADQLRALLRAPDRTTVSGLRNFAILLCCLLTGQRSSEIRLLRWGDIRTAGDDGAFVYIWNGGGQGSEHALHPAVYAALTSYLQAAGRLSSIQPPDYVFTPLATTVAMRLGHHQMVATTPISRQRVNQILHSLARRAGLVASALTTNALRRTATRLFYQASGNNFSLTAASLPYSSTATTLRSLRQPARTARDIWESVATLYGV